MTALIMHPHVSFSFQRDEDSRVNVINSSEILSDILSASILSPMFLERNKGMAQSCEVDAMTGPYVECGIRSMVPKKKTRKRG